MVSEASQAEAPGVLTGKGRRPTFPDRALRSTRPELHLGIRAGLRTKMGAAGGNVVGYLTSLTFQRDSKKQHA